MFAIISPTPSWSEAEEGVVVETVETESIFVVNLIAYSSTKVFSYEARLRRSSDVCNDFCKMAGLAMKDTWF